MSGFRLLLAPALLFAALPAVAAPRTPPDPIVRLELSPPELQLAGRGARSRVFVTSVRKSGARDDVTERAVCRSSGLAASAQRGGLITAARDGRTPVRVTFGGRSALLAVAVSRSSEPRPVSFRYEVLPILSKAGCNQGVCHGNSEGRGGFKLSLKGEDPEGDYQVIAHHGGGRRINPTDPGRSLLLLKATASLPHGGGMRFRSNSGESDTLAAWIAQGARDDPPGGPRLLSLEVTPAEAILIHPAKLQRLTVVGRFSDGTVRNLAEQAVYNSGDPAVEIGPDGRISAERGADAAVLVRFADQMRTARLTFVPARKQFAWNPPAAKNWIDEVHFRRLQRLRLNPSPLAGDGEFLRRVYLDAIGTLPTPDEAREFLRDCAAEKPVFRSSGVQVLQSRSSTKPDLNTGGPKARIPEYQDRREPVPALSARARLVERLLARPEWVEFWTLKWSDLLRLEERTLDPRGLQAYRDWIRASLAMDKPLDQFARELITGSGSTYTSPPANYYRRTRDAVELGENTAQVFMGTRMLCAKCHNHPFERWKQDDYYALAAFFARVSRKDDGFTRKDKFDLHERIGEEVIGVAAKGDVRHPRTNRIVPPRLPRSEVPLADWNTSSMGGGGDRRVAFAEWLTRPDNPYFARAMVNRVWYHLFGRGLVDPVDDLRESNPASDPALLDALAEDFAQHGFDLRRTIRTILNSATYQLSSEPNATNGDDDRFFSRSLPQRLTAEVLLDAICQATGAPETFANQPAGTRAVQVPPAKNRHPFLKLFGQPARESVCECERTGETTLGQSFALIGGELIEGKVRLPGNRIGALIAKGMPDREIVAELYLATVSREPTSREIEGALAYVIRKGDRRAALEDLLWALLNSKEFLLRR